MNTEKPELYIPALGGIYSSLDRLAEPMLRVFVGALFMPHGAQKLFGMFGGGGISGTAQFFDSIGYSPGAFWAVFLGTLELFGGIALVLGLFTRPVALLFFIFMAVGVSFHMANGFFWTSGGYEYPLLWAVASLYFAIRGGGRYSLDARIGKEF